MPTAIPAPGRPARRLSWRETARFFRLLARARWLHFQLTAAHRRVDRLGLDLAGGELLRLARRWLATHEEIAALLDIEAPPHVAQVRTVLRIQQNVMR